MKKFFTLILLLNISCLFSQVQITSSIPSDEVVCPGYMTTYSLKVSSNYEFCSATWSTSDNGRFYNNDNEGKEIIFIWDHQKPNKVEIQANVKYRLSGNYNCSNNASTDTVKFTHILNSAYQETLPNIDPAISISYCASNPEIILDAGPIYIKNTGGNDQPSQIEVRAYEWTLPAGWQTTDDPPKSGTFVTDDTNLIIIEPDNEENCPQAGTVKVRGISGCAGGLKGFTRVGTTDINISPDLTISPPPGFVGVTCGDRAPVTFTATNLSCASGYEWSFPSGWTKESSSGNSITLTPDGTPNTGGNIYASIILPCGTAVTKSYKINYIIPEIGPVVGPSFVCTSDVEYTLLNPIEGATMEWSSSNNLTITSSTNTSATVRVSSSTATGSGWIKAAGAGTCNVVLPVQRSMTVGENVDATITGLDQGVTMNTTTDFQIGNSNGCGTFTFNSTSDNVDILYLGSNYGTLTTNSNAAPGETGYVYIGVSNGSGIYKEFPIIADSSSPPVSPPDASLITIQRVPNTYPYYPYNTWKMVEASYSGGSVDYWEWQVGSSYGTHSGLSNVIFLPQDSYYVTVEARACNSGGCSSWQYAVIP